MDLFSFQEEGPGFPFFHPKGKNIINILISYLRKLLQTSDYLEISTPIMLMKNFGIAQATGHITKIICTSAKSMNRHLPLNP